MGVPILDHKQESLAAISVAGPTARLTRDKIPSIAAMVKQAAQSIAAQIGLAK